jgi:hypothetical protein
MILPTKVWKGVLACLFFLEATAAPGPAPEAHFPSLEAIRYADSRRWFLDSADARWQPVDTATPLQESSSAPESLAQAFVICDDTGWQLKPIIALHSERDEFLAVWEDRRNELDVDIYGQRLAVDGSLLGSEVALVIGPYDQLAPALFYSPAYGGYLLIWHHRQPGKYAIEGQRLSALGIPLDEPFRVPSPNEGKQWIPGCAYNTVSNELLVVWEDMTTSDILAQRISGNGVPLGDSITIATWPEGQWTLPLVAFSSTQRQYLVVWDALAAGDIHGQIVTADGALLGRDLTVSSAPGRQLASTAIYNSGSDEYFVLWTDERALAKRGSDIYGQRITSNATLAGDELVISAAPKWQRDCVASYDSTHEEYLLLWWDGRNATTASDIYGQRISAGGLPLGPNLVITAAFGNEILPNLVRSPTRDFFAIVWQGWWGSDSQGTAPDIYGLIYSPPRFLQWLPQVTYGSAHLAFSNSSLAQ